MVEPRADLLISRALDGDATGAEWDELAALAAPEPDLWRRVALGLRDRGGLGRAVDGLTAVAERIELPALEATPRVAPGAGPRPAGPMPRRRLLSATFGGWAVAALVVLAWGLTMPAPPALPVAQPAAPEMQAAGPGTGTTLVNRGPTKDDLASFPADDLRQAYLDRGRRDNLVVGELPEKVLVESRHAPSGSGYEVLFVRPILERALVPDLYEFGARDETGRPMPVPVRYDHPGPPR